MRVHTSTKLTTCVTTLVIVNVPKTPKIIKNNRKTIVTDILRLTFNRFWTSRTTGFRKRAVIKATINGIEIGKMKIKDRISNITNRISVKWRLVRLRNNVIK